MSIAAVVDGLLQVLEFHGGDTNRTRARAVVVSAGASARHRRGNDRRQGGSVRRAAPAGARGAPRQGQPPSASPDGSSRTARRCCGAVVGGRRRAARVGRRGGGGLRARPPGRVGARVGRRDRRAAIADRRLAGQALAGGARPDGRARGGDPVAQRPAVRPVLLRREARLAARERGGGPAGARRGHAAHGHGRLVPVRPARRRLRHRQLHRVAHAAAPARHARLRRAPVRAVRRAARRAARGARHGRRARRRSATTPGPPSCGCAARWWTSRPRSPARAASCRAA